MVRCHHHGEGQVLNVSLAGQIYWGRTNWEYMFIEDRRLADLRRKRAIDANMAGSHDAEAGILSPADGANLGPAREVTLCWQLQSGVTTYRVYFGVDPNDLALLNEVAQENQITGPALRGQSQYFWRVNAVQPDGAIIPGEVNSFHTGALVGWWRFDENEGQVAESLLEWID